MNRKYIDFVPKATASHEKTKTKVKQTPEVEPAQMLTAEDLVTQPMVSARSSKEGLSGAYEAKAKKITKRPLISRKKETKKATAQNEKAMESAVSEAHELEKELKIPKVAFVNTEKVVKRPLSKNVYTKKIEPPKEEPQGPVTIIAKPEKDSKAGLIVTIIITIILGAAAGTVAFLLLPK